MGVNGLKLALIIPDSHIPYEHKKAYGLTLKVGVDLCPDEIVILGDFGDFYAVNSHGKHPMLAHTLMEEVELINYRLDELDQLFPNAEKKFLEGNHEFRLERYIQNVAPGLFGVTETKNLLRFDQRSKWTFYPYGPNQSLNVLGSYLRARHEPLATSAKLTAARALCSLVYGHIHRIEESHIVGIDGTNHVAFSVGWLGDKRKDKVFGYVKNHHQWQMGFGLVWVDPVTNLFYHQKIHILDIGGELSCVVNGKIYK